MTALLARGILLLLPLWAYAAPAAADFRLCNNTGSRVGIASRRKLTSNVSVIKS